MDNYTEDMLLLSDSGYAMPFEEKDGDVRLTLGYGEQKHPAGGEDFFHHGVDFAANRYVLAAVADGIVTGICTDAVHGLMQTIRYGKYEVVYAHLSNILAPFGAKVTAGMPVSISGSLLHMEVRFDGREMNPIDFITMLYGNVMMTERQVKVGVPEFDTIEIDIPTDYDDDRKEVEDLMIRYYPEYLKALGTGGYMLPDRTEQSLRNLFSLSTVRNLFYETMPSLRNPLGVGQRAMPVAAKVLNLLIGDFLNFLALQYGIFLSTMTEESKKKTLDDIILEQGIVDPLADLEIDIQSFDIPRLVTVYPDRAGIRFWTKAWFNNSEDGEAAVEIERDIAVRFILGHIDKETMLNDYFPKQMEVYQQAMETTRKQLLGYS